MLNTFGVKVTVVELLDSLLPMEDSDVSKALTRSFEKAGITVMTGAGAENVQATAKKGVTLEVAGQLLSAEMLLVAIGRSNNVPDIGLETAGVKVARNVVEVDERMQTSVAGIYAIGDITGKQQLAHVASAQALVAAENAADGRATMDYTAVPNCIFTMPEIATVGLGEEQARAAGRDVRVGSFAYAALGKALAGNHTEGFYRIVADAKTDEILGVQIMGAHATDLIAEAALAIRLECTSEELGRTIHAHPTLAEGLMEAAHAVHGVCIHAPARRR
jgi:dihydrolipoamide dehydrogenase